uniref:Uncharacterized protein n=1 Tax=Pyramimonas orientalis virus TaxID=455367 RepID=A0A7M3UP11_POV01|nr:hypothetical protein HWQ62_00328 [Pyramimonas orientalis virus]
MEDKKVLYLTYMDVLKLLFPARGDKANRFQKWATRILFTIQMGDNNGRDEVASEALNVGKSTITELFRKSSRSFPCVYLFEIGTVGNMREHYNLEEHTDDTVKVYKYGMTSDITRRSSEHSKTYGKLNNNSFKIALFSYIYMSFMSKAENKLKQTMDKELIVVDKDNMTCIREMYNDISLCHSGNNKELISQIQEFVNIY